MLLCSTEAKPENKDLDSEEPSRGAEVGAAVGSQPQRVALFPGVDPSALKVTHLTSASLRCVRRVSARVFIQMSPPAGRPS